MWANMRIIVLLNSLKVGVTRSLRTRQMLKVDLCANGAGVYAPYAPPPAYGLEAILAVCKVANVYINTMVSFIIIKDTIVLI